MAQSWVEDVALPSFREGDEGKPALDGWFASSQVKLYLMVSALPRQLLHCWLTCQTATHHQRLTSRVVALQAPS